MTIFTADPDNPRGKRSGSLAGSGTHDEHTAMEADGAHDVDAGEDCVAGTAQDSGAGATELAAFIASRDLNPT